MYLQSRAEWVDVLGQINRNRLKIDEKKRRKCRKTLRISKHKVKLSQSLSQSQTQTHSRPTLAHSCSRRSQPKLHPIGKTMIKITLKFDFL
jgi:hypothetical protein